MIGNTTGDLRGLAAKAGSSGASALLNFLYYFLPNLQDFNVKSETVHNIPVTAGFVLSAITYGLMYVMAILAVSVLVFQRRNFK